MARAESIRKTNSIGRKEIFALAWPAILEMCLHMTAWIFDTAMVGRLGAAELSAVALGGQVYFSLVWVLGAVGIGITALVARHKGEEDLLGASHISEHGLFLALVLGAICTAVIAPNAHLVYRWAQTEQSVAAMGTGYVRALSLAAVIYLPTIAANGIMRGAGDTQGPLMVTIVTNIVNIVGDYLLIFGSFGFPRLGVLGAGYALVSGQIIGGIFAVILLLRRTSLRLRLSQIIRPNSATLKRIIRVSIPAAVEALLRDGARTFSTMIIASMGTITLAAHQVTVTAESLSFMPGYGFAIAASIVTGQRLGAGQPDEAEKGTSEAWRMGLIVMCVMGIAFLLFPEYILRLFTTDPEVIRLGARCLRIAAFMQPAICTSDVFAGALRGAGDTETAMYISGISSWVIRVPLIVIGVYVLDFSLEAIWVVILAEIIFKAAAAWNVFNRGRWKQKKV